jgi:hypothetical protein
MFELMFRFSGEETEKNINCPSKIRLGLLGAAKSCDTHHAGHLRIDASACSVLLSQHSMRQNRTDEQMADTPLLHGQCASSVPALVAWYVAVLPRAFSFGLPTLTENKYKMWPRIQNHGQNDVPANVSFLWALPVSDPESDCCLRFSNNLLRT